MKKKLLITILGILLFVLVLSSIDLSTLIKTLTNADGAWILLGILTIPMLFLLAVIRWYIMLHAAHIPASLLQASHSMIKGLFWGELTPGRLGELYRAKYITKKSNTSIPRALATVILDRFYDITMLVGLAVFGSFLVLNQFTINVSIAPIIITVIVVVLIGSVLLNKKMLSRTLHLIVRFLVPSSYRPQAYQHLGEFSNGVSFQTPRIHIIGLSISALSWTIKSVQIYLLAYAVGIHSVPFSFIILITPVIILLSIVPVTILGLGTREAGFIFFLALYDVPAESAVATSLLFLVFGFLTVLLLGPITTLLTKMCHNQKNSSHNMLCDILKG